MSSSKQSNASRLWFTSVCALTATMILAPAAMAGLIASCQFLPGGSCSPPDDAGDTPGTLLASRIDPFSFTTSSGTTHGAIKAEVFQEMGGTLDFYYIVFNAPDSATSIMRETNLNFGGWATSVAFRSDGSNVPGFVDGNILPFSADRDLSGANVGFNFGGVPPNERSRVVIVSTNGFYFAAGGTVIDGSGPLATFEPAVPEPRCLVLFSTGLIGLVAARKRARRLRELGCRIDSVEL